MSHVTHRRSPGPARLIATSAAAASLLASALAVVNAPASAETAAGSGKGASCVSKAERRAVAAGMGKSQVKRIFDGPGVKVKRRGGVEVRRHLACSGRAYVIVTFRNGRLIRVKQKPVAGLGPTPSVPPVTSAPANTPAATAGTRLQRYDADGNGTLDYIYDANADGYYETVLIDSDGNGRFETIFLDNGSAQGVFRDSNEDGYFETLLLDADRNGLGERIYYDGNGDGFPEWQMWDYRPVDGVADTWFGTAPSSSSAQDRTADNLMVRNRVTLNQLRQFDPTSLAYIPDGSTPTLLSDYTPNYPDYESPYN